MEEKKPTKLQKRFQKILGIESPQTPVKKVSIPREKTVKRGGVSFAQEGLSGFGLPNVTDHYALAQYQRSWVYACVTKIAEEASNVNIFLYKKDRQGNIEEVKSHPVLDLLDRVNSHMTFYDLKELTFSYIEVTGRAFWWIVKDDAGKEIIEINPMLIPSRMRIIPDPVSFIGGYKYFAADGKEVTFDPDEIIYFKTLSLDDPYSSMSPVIASQIALETDLAASLWNYRFFKNQARPDGLIEYDAPLSRKRVEEIMEAWKLSHGEGKEHRVGVISGGKWKETSRGQKDMDFNSMRLQARDEILATFRVPKSVLGITDQSVNRAVAEAQRAQFLGEVVVPKVVKFVNSLNEFLLPHFATSAKEVLFFDYENPVPEDIVSNLAYYANGKQNGWLTANEIRAMEGLDPVDGGDVLSSSQSFNPLGLSMKSDEQPTLIKNPIRKLKHKPNITPRHRPDFDIIKEKIKKALKTSDKLVKVNKQMTLLNTREKQEEYWKKKIAITDGVESRMVLTLQRLFNRQKEAIIQSLRKKKKNPDIITKDFEVNFDVEKETGLFIKVFSPFIEDIVKDFGQDALRTIVSSEQFDATKSIERWIKTYGLKFAKEVNKTTKESINEQIAAGVDAGESIDKIASRITDVFDEASESRAYTIARSEVARSTNFGTLEGWKQSKVVKYVKWLTAFDELVCPYCGPMDQQEPIKIGETFFDKGDDFTGDAETPLEITYENIETPPLHPNCRCVLIPITEEINQ